MRCALACSVLAGCSFVGRASAVADGPVAIDAPAATIDALDAQNVTTIDAPVDCKARWHAQTVQLSAPVLVAFANPASGTAGARDPFLSPDELTIYFASNNDVNVATRTALDAPFGMPTVFAPASSSASESKMSMTFDGTFLVVASDRSGGKGMADIWAGPTTLPPSLDETHLDSVDDGNNQLDPSINDDGTHLYLAPVPAGNPQEIDVAIRGAMDQDFATPTKLKNINSSSGEADPALTPDELVIVFSSRRNAGQGVDLYYATRDVASNDFDAPSAIPAVNGPDDDNDPVISRDGCRLYFSSHRSGTDELYVVSMM